ncbi:hypothetical protein H5410_003517 [Solanum commersonii]|uniref:CCHC-type domain-containing protein n=1 Tax=Solanum commersonii TaxID=4109 RepID=A0A9J6B597_SOLCO|nr:hypothetical protein H5410_003517 [Solanum commersonii]
MRWAMFKGAFMGHFFTRELRVAKGSMAQGGNGTPACGKCGRNHSGVCRDGFTGCFKCGHNGHFVREFLKNRKGGGNGGQ